MKKFLMTIAAAFVAVSMNAQVYVGGSLNFSAMSSQKLAGDQSETVFKILPEIGYNLNEEWAIGTVIGYENNKWEGVADANSTAHFGNFIAGNTNSESAFTFNPYVRYTFLKAGRLNVFVDGGVDFTTATKGDWSRLGAGFKPGLAVSLNDNISFVSHLGFIGWEQFNPDGDDNNTSNFGLDLSGANLTFGLYLNF